MHTLTENHFSVNKKPKKSYWEKSLFFSFSPKFIIKRKRDFSLFLFFSFFVFNFSGLTILPINIARSNKCKKEKKRLFLKKSLFLKVSFSLFLFFSFSLFQN
ncbi:hypothetical protein ADIAL_0010 [Alkalibacterium sp. AK22]|nr:hypothetical protein ADIAL_0010 [Alkalibacterium sp. AK22]